MLNILTIDPTKLQQVLVLLKSLLKPKFPEAPLPQNSQGAKRKWPRFLIIALALIKECLLFTWEDYVTILKSCNAVILGFEAKKVPGKTSLFDAWDSIPEEQVKGLVKAVGQILCPNPNQTSIDSTGTLLKAGSVWRLLKWGKSRLKKTSRWFYKAHIVVETTQRVVLAIELSVAHRNDLPQAFRLLNRLGSRILTKIKEMYRDKAYTDKKLAERLAKKEINLIVEPKKNAKDHGTNSIRDRSVRLYQQNKKLWKYTFRTGRKASVEIVFGIVKMNAVAITARKKRNKRKQFIVGFFQYNFNLYLQRSNFGG